jgi:hypothetical protein
MFTRQNIILSILILAYFQISYSQISKSEKDSSKVNNPIQSNPLKSKIPKFFQGLIFEPFSISKNKKIISPKKHLQVEGKIIRNIIITTLDPFGFSDIDTTITPQRWIEKTGNRLHLKSKQFAIKNYLLFNKNSPYNLFSIKESERIIRSQNFVNSVNITEKLTSSKSDSVDVYIRVLDSWSTVPKLSFSKEQKTVGLNERNFLGIGHQLDYTFTNRTSDGKSFNNLVYTVPNIKNTFIKTIIKYTVDLDNYYDRSLDIERPFYSPLTKWAAGISLNQQYKTDTLQNASHIYFSQNFKFSTTDLWIGKAIPIFKGNSIGEKTTNLIIAERFLNIDYPISPTTEFDPIDFYAPEKLLLSGIGINTRQFIVEKYIFRNGIIEDVPVGRIYGLIFGYQYKNNNWRPYIGGQITFGNYHKWGFLSTDFQAGTFFDKSKTEQTAFSFQANYFTNLIELGNWKFRQFIKPQIIVGSNRKNSLGDRLNINEEHGIQGFNSPVYGTKKMVLTLQTQSYAPKDIWGFRMNPYFNYSIAILGNKANGTTTTKTYSKIGLGVLINNDYLVFSSFQISLSYYPKIPFIGDHLFRTNAFETADIGLQSFELAKPKIVLYE